MKFLLILIALFSFSISCYSQSDSIALNTPAIFSITFKENKKSLIFDRNHTSYKEVYLDVLTKDYLIIRKKFDDENNPNAISRYVQISLKDVEALGYATGKEETFGALLGAGIGLVGGTIVSIIATSFDRDAIDPKYDSTTSKFGVPILIGIGSGALLGYFFGGMVNSYETFELSRFDNEKKYLEINKIVKKGLKYPRKK